MSNINATFKLNIQDELDKLSLYKYHPNGILNIALNRLKDMLDGKVEISDPSNPFIYLLETNCLNTAFAVQEYTLLTRKLYPRLANQEEDLYLHMSDIDYLNRFSEPAFANVLFNILLNDFKDKAVYNPTQKEYILKIPRHFKLTVDKYVFTLTSAVIIRLTENDVLDVKFENQNFNNPFPVQTNYINFNVFKINQTETYLNFELKLPEIDIETIEIPVEKSKLFKNTLTYNPNRQFYYYRAFYFKDGKWHEMLVTHTDMVYDIYKPTCIIKVLQEKNSLEYYIPPVYINNEMIGSKVKFLIYTTNGSINVNFNDYKIGDFKVEYNPVFQEEELDKYTEPLQLITKVIYIKDEVVGGKNKKSFIELRNNVIENNVYDRKLPITNKHIEFESKQRNFKLIKDVDIVTNRIFLLECNIPNALTRYPIAKFNFDIIEYKTTITDLRLNTNNVVAINDNVTIIPENTVFKMTDNSIRILDKTEYTRLVSLSGIDLATEVNNNNYLSLMYHYILDTSDNKTDLRAYDISKPIIKQINFKEFNPTARIGINTSNITIAKTSNGFIIDILSNLKKYVNGISEANITPYIVYRDNDSTFYLEGRLYTKIKENPVYRFELDSNYYIDANNRISISNFKDANNNLSNISLDLDSTLEIIYVSNVIPVNYTASSMDNYIYNSFLAVGRVVVTLEEIKVKFGYHLERLFTRVHTSTGTYTYETYEEDIPLRYKSTVYNSNNEIIHMVNDIVYDNDGNIVYEHRKGDIKLDENGRPIPISNLELNYYINLLFIDYKIMLSNKNIIKDYRNYVKSYLTEQIVENAKVIQEQLLENTEAFVVVPRNINQIKVKTPTKTTYIKSMQKFQVTVFVNEKIYNDIETRDNIVYVIVSEIDKYLHNNTSLSKTELLNILYNKLREFISSISIDKFTELNEEYIKILDTNARISLNKLLVAEPDGYDLKEDLSVTFHLV